MSYYGWYDDNKFEITIKKSLQPLQIKEKDKTWYLVTYCPKNNKIQTFCLDERLREIHIFKKKITGAINFNEAEYFKNSIGILNDATKPEKIVIQVANHHLKYLISKPLHSSQKITAEPKKWDTKTLDYSDPEIWGTIEVYLKPNYEFIMEMLKYNHWVKITAPKSVVHNFKEQLGLIVNYYNY